MSLIDGSHDSQWFETMTAGESVTVRLELAAPAPVTRYDLFTANDAVRRDPVRWPEPDPNPNPNPNPNLNP